MVYVKVNLCNRMIPHPLVAYFPNRNARVCVCMYPANKQAAPSVMSMRAHSTAVQDSLKDYRFGSANDRQVPSHKLSDSQVREGFNPTKRFLAGCTMLTGATVGV